jgi:predicted kinase
MADKKFTVINVTEKTRDQIKELADAEGKKIYKVAEDLVKEAYEKVKLDQKGS